MEGHRLKNRNGYRRQPSRSSSSPNRSRQQWICSDPLQQKAQDDVEAEDVPLLAGRVGPPRLRQLLGEGFSTTMSSEEQECGVPVPLDPVDQADDQAL